MPAALRVIPLGGLGEIGNNCMAFEHEDRILVLDCGVTFDARGLGIDLVHADLRWLIERRERVLGLVLTHGHEDHIGAVSWFLRDVPVPVWGPPYALALVRQRIAEHPFHDVDRLDLRPMSPGAEYGVGPFSWELWRVTHSMPQSHGLILRTPQGLVLHTGDFKIDRDPPAGDRIDLERIADVAREGVRLLLSDSTNALTPGQSAGEKAVEAALAELVHGAPERVVVALFSSNVGRMRVLFELARQTGRKVVALGRSVQTHLRIAEELGILPDPHDVLVPPEHARRLPRRQLLAICTGSQGEAPAALPRLAARSHPDLELQPGDRVILSSRIIPGNERAVFEMIDALARCGIEVIHRGNDPRVHASGHAHREEQRAMIETVRPRAFLPVHGTFTHLTAHAAIAREAGVPEVFVLLNGDVLEIDEHGGRLVGRVPAGRVYVDHYEPISQRVIHDRTLLARLGVVFVTLLVDRDGHLLDEPAIVSRGVLDDDVDTELVDDLMDEIDDAVAAARPRSADDPPPSDEALQQVAQRAVRRFFLRELGRKPLCHAVVMRA